MQERSYFKQNQNSTFSLWEVIYRLFLCVNDGGEFGRTSADTYLREIKSQLEYHGTHTFFLNPDINIMDGKFVYKLFDKRSYFPFLLKNALH